MVEELGTSGYDYTGQFVERGLELILDGIALELNGRPRKTLGFMTPSEKFAEAVAATP